MKIYKLTKGDSSSTNYCYPSVMDESPWSDENLFISECSKIYDLPIPYSVDNKTAPGNFPLCHNILVSKKFLEVIKQLNETYTALESQMHYDGKNKKAYLEQHDGSDEIWDIYYTMLFPAYSFFNWDKSDFSKYYNDELNKTFVTRINRLVLDKNKIEATDFTNNIFHLKEKKTYLLCTEKAKLKIEETGIAGIAFEEVEVL